MDLFKDEKTPKKQTQLKENPSFQVPRSLKFGIQTLQKLAPTLAKKLALKVFFTPIKFPTPERELPYKNKANMYRNMVAGKKITVYQSGKGRKKILLVHGWSGRATQFYEIEKALVGLGVQVYSFTAPAHGSSEDKQTHMLEFAECVKQLDLTYGPFDGFVGHSLGGMAIMNALSESIKNHKIALIGVPATIGSVLKDFARNLMLNQRTTEAIESFLVENYGEDFERQNTARLAAQTFSTGLIVHDINDLDVAFSEAEMIHKAWPKSTLVQTTGLGHRRIISDPETAQKIANFLV